MDFIFSLFMDFVYSTPKEGYFFISIILIITNIGSFLRIKRYEKMVDELETENLHLESYIYMEDYGDEYTKRI